MYTYQKYNDQSSVNYFHNNGYSTLFICLIAPLILCSIKIKWNLYPLAFSKFLLSLIPDIIVNNPVIFIFMTISNILTLYIVFLSLFDKNTSLKENIIYLFNRLKECKFSPFKIKLLLKNIAINLRKSISIKFKQLKDNWLSILLTLIIIIVVANMFRKPIFIFLGEDIFNNFYLYIYVMFGSILPTTYIVTILIKWFKTSNLDFSFRLTDLKERITILSIILLTVSLYISYFYIWPLIGFTTIYFIQSKTTFINLILNPRNVQGLRFPRLMILPGLSVAGVFGHFESSFTKDEILSTIENYEPVTHDANPSGKLTQYSQYKWITKIASTNNIKANAEYSAQNIKAPYIPTSLFKSYRDNFMINFEIGGYDITHADLPVNIALYYFKMDSDFYCRFGGPTGGGWVNRPLADIQTTYLRSKHCAMMTQSNKPISEILRQISISASQIIPNCYNREPSPFIIICHEKRIAFAMYRPSQTLEQNYPFKKGRTFQDFGDPTIYTDTPNLCGIIGLIATSWGVETIPHQNVYRPQLAFYDFTNERHAFAIHMIFKYLSLNRTTPELNDDFIQINNDSSITANLTEKNIWIDDLNIKLEQNGRLIR